MDKTIRILGIAGSLRQQSYNRGTLRAAVELTPEGAEIEIFELGGIPGFNQAKNRIRPKKSWNSNAKSARLTPFCLLRRNTIIQFRAC